MAVILLIVASMILTVSWTGKSKKESTEGYFNRIAIRVFWVGIHLYVLGIVAIKLIESYIDRAISAVVMGACNEGIALLGVTILILVIFSLIFDVAIGLNNIEEYNFIVYSKDMDRLLTYYMNLLAVLGFFYPAIDMNGKRESRGMLVCALAALLDMVALDLYRVAVYPLGIGSWMNQKIKPVIDGRCHRIRERFQKVESKKKDLSHKTFSFKRKHYHKVNLVNWENKKRFENLML